MVIRLLVMRMVGWSVSKAPQQIAVVDLSHSVNVEANAMWHLLAAVFADDERL